MTVAATDYDKSPVAGHALGHHLRIAVEPCVTFLYGFLAVALVAGSTGGYLPTTQGWTAVLTFWIVAIALLLRDRLEISRLGVVFVGSSLAFTAWVALSNLWTPSMTSTMHEVQRNLAYVGLAAAGLVLTSRRTVPHLLGGVLTAITILSLYALGTRIFPDRLGGFDSEAFGYRLATPITYWNGLGIFAVLGMLLALGVAARARHLISRACAAAAIPLLATTMYFTFSRGAWVALALGLIVAIGIDPRRLQLVAIALVLTPWAALAIAAADRRPGLTTVGTTFGQAIDDGHSLVVPLVALAVVSGLVAAAAALVERFVRIPRVFRAAFATILVAALVAGAATTWHREGSPWHLANSAWDRFQAPPKGFTPDVSDRLLQFSADGRIELWRVSWNRFEEHPLLGTGAGTFWQDWVRYRDEPATSAEGHSLYFEVLGELGLPGLVLLAAALAMPLVGGIRGRATAFVPPALGAYAAWAIHAGVDWDWELVGVSAVGLLVGVGLIRTQPVSPRGTTVRISLVVACLALSGVAVGGLIGSLALRDAAEGLDGSAAGALARTDRAARWAPWSSTPAELRAAVHVSQGRNDLARAAYRAAIAKDPDSWLLWSALANVSTGAERARALARVRLLNPLALEHA